MFFCRLDISAYPDSINVLEGVSNDVRTPDKLINGMNDTQDGKQMWLAPIVPSVVNMLYNLCMLVIPGCPLSCGFHEFWKMSQTASVHLRKCKSHR